MCSSSGDIVCTLIIIEISDIWVGAYRKFRLKLRGGGEEGALICGGLRHRLVETGAS